MNPNGRNFELVAADFRGKAVDRYGQQVYKGGQTVDSGIIQSALSSYSLLVYHPIAATMLFLGSFILVAEFFGVAGPLEYLANTLLLVVKDPNSTQFARVSASFASVVVLHAVDWKFIVAKICLVWFTYVVKPSGRNMIYAGILTIIVLLMHVTYFKLFLMTQCFFLFACIRSPFWKFVILVFFFFFTFTDILNFTKVVSYLEITHKKFNKTIP